MVGIDPESDFTIKPWLEGHLQGKLKEDEILLGSDAHIFLGRSESQVGDKEFFYGKEFTVAGVLEPTGIGIDESGYITLSSAYEIARSSDVKAVKKLDVSPGQISALMVKVGPTASRTDVARDIERNISGVAVVSSRELMSSSVARQLESLTPGLFLIGAGFWVIAVLMIGALFSMIVNERRRELGLLQAMGATRSFLFRLVMLEAVELTVTGGVAGLAAGAGVIAALKDVIASSMGIDYQWPGAGFITFFTLAYMLMAALTGVVAGLYPAYAASRLEPYQAIRTGE